MNYLLNLEYLEAEYYLRATTGSGLPAGLIGSSPGAVTGGAKVPFQTPFYSSVAAEFATIEQDHVQSLQGVLFSGAVSRPTINFTAGFQAVGSLSGIGSSFNPFADESSFLLGAFFLADLVSTAYAGVFGVDSGLLGSIMNVECYQGGVMRAIVISTGGTLLANATAIKNYRSTYGGGAETSLTAGTQSWTALYTELGASAIRQPSSILELLYESSTGVSGSFFPKKFNGFIL